MQARDRVAALARSSGCSADVVDQGRHAGRAPRGRRRPRPAGSGAPRRARAAGRGPGREQRSAVVASSRRKARRRGRRLISRPASSVALLEQQAQVAQRRRSPGPGRRGWPSGAARRSVSRGAGRLLQGDRELAGQRREQVHLVLAEGRARRRAARPARPARARRRARAPPARPRSRPVGDCSGIAPRSAQRSSSASGGKSRGALAARRATSSRSAPAVVGRVEGHAVVAAGRCAMRETVQLQRAARGRRSRPWRPDRRPARSRRAACRRCSAEDLPAAQEGGGGPGEDREQLHVGLGEAARLVGGDEQAEHARPPTSIGHQHDRLRAGRLHQLVAAAAGRCGRGCST